MIVSLDPSPNKYLVTVDMVSKQFSEQVGQIRHTILDHEHVDRLAPPQRKASFLLEVLQARMKCGATVAKKVGACCWVCSCLDAVWREALVGLRDAQMRPERKV